MMKWRTFGLAVLALGLSFSVVAFADPQPVQWESGTVHLQGNRVVVKFSDGTYFEIANARPGTERSYRSSARPSIDLAVPPAEGPNPIETYNDLDRRLDSSEAKDRPNATTIFGLYDQPAAGAPIAGLRVIRVRNEGSSQLIWVLGAQTQSDSNGSYQGGIWGSPYVELGNNRIGLKAMTYLKQGMPEYPNEMALIEQAKSHLLLLVHDDWSSTVRVIMFQTAQQHRNAAAADQLRATGWEFAYPLPGSFARGKPFDESGELLYVPENATGTLVLKPRAGEPVRLALGNAANNGAEDVSGRDYFERKKLGSRVLWERGSKPVLALLERLGWQASSSSVLRMHGQFSDWLNRSPKAAPVARPQGEKARAANVAKVGDLLVLTMSKAAQSFFGGLRGELAAELMDAAPTKMPFYLRLPAVADIARYNEAINLLVNQIQGQGHGGQDTLVIVDATDASITTAARHGGLELPINSLFELLANTGIRQTRIAMLCRPDQTDDLETIAPYVRGRDQLAVDALIPATERATIVQQGLSQKGHELELALVERLLAQIERESPRKGMVFTDLSSVVRDLTTVFYHGQLKPDAADFVESTSRMFAQITGDRRVGPFPAELVRRLGEMPRVLSTNYPGHSENAMTGRDWLLRTLERKLTSWVAYGHKEHPVLPLFFAGDNGTGKTMTAAGIAEVMGGAVETINLSALARAKKSSWSWYDDDYSSSSDDADLVQAVREKVERLVLNPNPVKILVLDELHTTPELLTSLLPAFGNGDRKAPGVINLDGLIVIMIANVDTSTEAYARLSQIMPGDPTYPQSMFQLFKESLSGKGSGMDEKLVGALAGRLLPGMYFFPPLGLDREQQDSLIEKLITEYEAKNKMRIVVQDSAREHLMKLAGAYTDGNYRAVERALREEITGAFARFLVPDPSRNLEGYFVLGVGKAGDGRDDLSLLKVEGDGTGSLTVVQDSYARFALGLKTALGFAVDSLATGAAAQDTLGDNRAEVLRRNYALMTDAFTRASGQPLFSKVEAGAFVEPALDDLELPAKLSPTQQMAMRKFLSDQVRGLFTAYADYTRPPGAMKTRDAFLDISQRLNHVLSGLARLSRVEAESTATDRPFARWIEKVRQRYLVANPGANVAAGSIDALAVAAGYLANDVGRRSAAALLADLASEARRKSLLQPMTAPAQTGAAVGVSSECERLLKGGALASDELDKLLGRI